MATAAPTAPSPAAEPVAAPQAAPAPDAGKPAESKPIKPIPPDAKKTAKPAPTDVDLGFARNKEALSGEEDIIPEMPRRDPETGRFITKSERQEKDEQFLRRQFQRPDFPEGAEVEPTEKPPEPPKLPPEEAKKLVFLGKEVKDISEVEHQHKTLQGAHRKAVEERDYGYRAANAWEQIARTLGYQDGKPVSPRAQAAQQPPQEPAGPTELTADALLDGIDGKAFEIVMAREGLPEAVRYLGHEILSTVIQKVVPYVREQVRAEYGPMQESVQRTAAEQAIYEQGVQVADQLAELRGPNGNPAFPEVSNPQILAELGDLAERLVNDTSSGWTAERIFTHQGMMQLIAFYRMLKGFAPEQPVPAPAPAPAPVQTSEAPAAAALVSAEPGTSTPPHSGRMVFDPSMSPLDRRLARSLSATNPELVDPHLGFQRNRRL